ncbi:hypothetical protein BEN74_05525 [Acinetobacter sp. WCHAc010034]|nr:hypothetical protein BEN74_05525 [Acinetobacter sp. WCHAc010034]
MGWIKLRWLKPDLRVYLYFCRVQIEFILELSFMMKILHMHFLILSAMLFLCSSYVISSLDEWPFTIFSFEPGELFSE